MGYLSWNYRFFTTGKLKTLLAKAYAFLLTEELSIHFPLSLLVFETRSHVTQADSSVADLAVEVQLPLQSAGLTGAHFHCYPLLATKHWLWEHWPS